MNGSSEDFSHVLAAARAALGRGDRAEAEQLLRHAIDIAEHAAVAGAELVSALNALAALRRDMDELTEAEALFQRALSLLEGMPEPDDLLMFATCTGLGGVRATRGEAADAERLLTRALALGERRLGGDHPDLGGLLNDLSRLFLKSGAYASAERLLLRLYEMKGRSKGEDHPEAATVLASLASVREALGRHDEAEIMWRRVLAVRERTLPPNHFATATALERLAESCAARGKLREALQLLKRATTMRELTLGPTHHSVRIARDRIADLQLQSSADAPDGFVEPPPRAQAVPQPLPPFLPLPAPQAAPERAARAEVPTLSGAPDGHALQMQLQAPPSHEELAVIQAEHEELLAIQADQEKLLAIEAKLAAAAEYEDGEEEGEERSVGKSLAAAALLMDRRRIPVIVTGAVAVVLLLGAGVVRSRAASPVGSPQELQASVPAPSEPADARSGTRLVPATATAPAPITVEHREVLPAALETVHRPPAAQRRDDGDAAPSRSQIATAPVVAPKLLKNLDSFARSVKTPAVSMSDAYSVRLASDSPNKKFDPGVPENASELVRAELIGAPPQPRFPEGLRDRKLDGEVVIRFVVDAQGRPDPATITILRSPHELFSEAVRRVIPTMRFEAAHRTGIGARAEPDQVQMAFRFSSGTR